MKKHADVPTRVVENTPSAAVLIKAVLEKLSSYPSALAAFAAGLQEQYRAWWRSVYERKEHADLESYRRFYALHKTRLLAFRGLPLPLAIAPPLSFLWGKGSCVYAEDREGLKEKLLAAGFRLSEPKLIVVETTARGIVTFFRADGTVELMFPNSPRPSKLSGSSWSWD